jgi:hypothetical protein
MEKFIRNRLGQGDNKFFIIYTMVAAFGAYFCMYAFRKPFTVGTFSELSFLGMDLKTVLVISQVLGYALSKFLGIKIISELKSQSRYWMFLGLMAFAELMLLMFAWVPVSWKVLFIFLNGIPLGLIWGIVFSYLEGRKMSELLGAGLSISFIVSSGAVKSVGKWLILDFNINEFWMPVLTGLIFFPFLILFSRMLHLIPPPNETDQKLRTKRAPLNARQRRELVQKFALGIFLMVIFYTLLSAYRDFRDNFAVEIWSALGYSDQPSIFTISEIPIALIVLFIVGSLIFVKDNKKALALYHYLIVGSMFLVILCTILFQAGVLPPAIWMVLMGLGLYLAYVPFNCLIFDRLLAAFKYVGTAGFLIYVADSFGYLGSISILLIKNFGFLDLSWLDFFVVVSYILGGFGSVLMIGSLFYFNSKFNTHSKNINFNEIARTTSHL